MTRINMKWPPVVERARQIANSYNTPVTLRQLFYRLVAEQAITNSQSNYVTLSSRTSEARREGRFPELADLGRQVEVAANWDSAEEAKEDLRRQFRLDRTIGQPCQVYISVEKRGILAQLHSWFDDRTIPIIAFGGYSSQTIEFDIMARVAADGRPAVLLYAGDFDPSGEDIIRNFVKQTNCWGKVVQIALTNEQVDEYNLPEAPAKKGDTRSKGFQKKHGKLVQVEMDAIEPNELRRLYENALSEYWDEIAYEDILATEAIERESL